MTGCAVDGCPENRGTRGLCPPHYQRIKKNGGPWPRAHGGEKRGDRLVGARYDVIRESDVPGDSRWLFAPVERRGRRKKGPPPPEPGQAEPPPLQTLAEEVPERLLTSEGWRKALRVLSRRVAVLDYEKQWWESVATSAHPPPEPLVLCHRRDLVEMERERDLWKRRAEERQGRIDELEARLEGVTLRKTRAS